MRHNKIWLKVLMTIGLATIAHVIYWYTGNNEKKTDPMKRMFKWLKKK